MLVALLIATLASLIAAGLVALAQHTLQTRHGLDPQLLDRAVEHLEAQGQLTATELAEHLGCPVEIATRALRASVDEQRYTMAIDDEEAVLRYLVIPQDP